MRTYIVLDLLTSSRHLRDGMFCNTSRKRRFSLLHPTRGRLRPRGLFGGLRKTSSSGLAGHRLSCAQRSALRAAAFSAASARSPLAVAFRPRFARNAASENGRRHQRFKLHVTQHDVELFSVRKNISSAKKRMHQHFFGSRHAFVRRSLNGWSLKTVY